MTLTLLGLRTSFHITCRPIRAYLKVSII